MPLRGRHSADVLASAWESHKASREEWALSLSCGRNRVQRTELLGVRGGRHQQGLGLGEGRPLRGWNPCTGRGATLCVFCGL